MSVAEVGSWIRDYISSSENPDLLEYGSNVLKYMERFLWFTRHPMDLGALDERGILDVGCGFGWGAVALSMLGRNHVVASDIRDTMTTAVQERVDSLKRKGARLHVEVMLADICDRIATPEERFDAIVCQEAIEHIHDLEAMFANCALLLKPGGRLLIANAANVLNAHEAAELRAIWAKSDQTWDYIE